MFILDCHDVLEYSITETASEYLGVSMSEPHICSFDGSISY